MLAERIKKWPERWVEEGREEGRLEAKQETARNLIARTEMDDAMIAEIAGLTIEDVAILRA